MESHLAARWGSSICFHLFPSGHLAYVGPHSPQAQISFSPMFVPGGLMGLVGMLGPMGQMDLFGPMGPMVVLA